MKPPRLARWMLSRVLPPGPEGDTIRDDLIEEYGRRVTRSRLQASLWYWRAVVSMQLRYRPPHSFHPATPAPSLLGTVVQDLRYEVRTFVKAPVFTMVVVVTLALGIGATTAIFSALNAVLLKPLPYPNADRVVRLVSDNTALGVRNSMVSAADLLDWQRDARSFETIGAFYRFSTSVLGATPSLPAERLAGAAVYNLFDILGVPPAVGRDFSADEKRRGGPPAVIAGNGFWQRRFGAKVGAVGQPLRPGSVTTLVGVMPPAFSYPDDVELWVPTVLDGVGDPRTNRRFEALGRLRPGVSVREAQVELDTITARLESAYPASNNGWRVRVVPLADFIIRDARQTLWLLLGAVLLVMLVACANVASLFLAQAEARRREIAVRAAVGAGRGRILRQVLTESILLSFVAGGLGILLGNWGLRLLITIAGAGIPRLEQASLDHRVLFFTLLVSCASGVLFGVLPAVQLARANPGWVHPGGARGPDTRFRIRRMLVIAEVAIALVLFVSSGLLGRSFQGLKNADVGFRPENLLTVRVTLAGVKYREPGSDVTYFAEAIRRISAIPSVRSAAAVLTLPVGGGGFGLGRGFIRPGLDHPAEGYNAEFEIVTPGYFKTLGVPLLQGRDFDEHDTASGTRVAVINRTLAERFFPGEDPVGQKIHVWIDEPTPREIVGVVGDLKSADLAAAAGPDIFVPNTQSSLNDLTLVVRTDSAPAAVAAPVKAVLQNLDPTQPAYDVKTFETIMSKA